MKNLWVVVLVIVLMGGSFYGGMTYGQSSAAQNSAQNGRNFAGGRMGGAGGQAGSPGGAGGARGGNATVGQVLSKDDKSVTLKLNNGGSVVVFFSGTTQLSKSVSATVDDLAVGKNLLVTGTKNTDGSVIAQMIQLRPDMPVGINAPVSGTNSSTPANPAVVATPVVPATK